MYNFKKKKRRKLNYFGIDRTTLNGITVKNINTKVLLSAIDSYDRNTIRLEYTTAETPLQINKDNYIKSIFINFNGAVVNTKYTRIGFSGSYTVDTKLQLQINSNSYNLKPLTIEEYRQRVTNIFTDIEYIFGVEYDYSSAVFTKIELNKTFTIEKEFKSYKTALNLLYSNIPPNRFSSNELKLATWSSINSSQNIISTETKQVKSKRRTLKTYDKVKQLIDVLGQNNIDEKLLELNHKVMRFEYTITDKDILKKYLTTNAVFDEHITDKALKTLFNEFIEKDILNPYYKWREQNTQNLIDLINDCKAVSQHWRLELIRRCRAYDNLHNIPLLVDVNDLKGALLVTEKSTRTAIIKLNKFKALISREREFNRTGNTALLTEVINKLKS
jgi:hypothetical protein